MLLPRAQEGLNVSPHWNSISSFPNRWRVTPDAAGIGIAKTRSNVDQDRGGFAIPVARKRNYVRTAFLFRRRRTAHSHSDLHFSSESLGEIDQNRVNSCTLLAKRNRGKRHTRP